jgi:hypothetical protein
LAEFASSAFRFCHSQLTETVALTLGEPANGPGQPGGTE